MPLSSANKINKLLSEGIPNGLYFSEWLAAINLFVRDMLLYLCKRGSGV